MSPIGRIFSVLNLVLAALFLSWAALALADADSYRKDLESAEASMQAEIDGLEDQLAQANEARTQAEGRAGRLQDDRDDLSAEKDRLQNEITDLERVNSEMRTNLAGISESLESMRTSLEAAEQAKTDANERAFAAEQAKEEALQEQTAAQTKVSDLRAQIAALESDLQSRQERIAALNDDLQNKQTELEVLMDATGVDAASIVSMPMINGVVIEALYDVEPGLVAINKGSADDVKRGYTFDVYAGADYKGRVRVENVRENSCTAIVTQPVEGKRIGQGDKASTRL